MKTSIRIARRCLPNSNRTRKAPIWNRAFAPLATSIAALLSYASIPSVAHGAVWTFTSGGNASGFWSTSANWSGSVPNAVDATADFSTLNLTADSTIALTGTETIGSLIFGDTTPSNNWIVSGSALTLATSVGTPMLTVNNQAVTVNTPLTGTQGLIKAGSGTLLLTASNRYTGTTTLTAGALNLGDKGALGSGTLALNGGTLAGLTPLTGANAVANNITLGGNITVQGNNSLELSGTVSQTSNRTLTNNISGGGSLIISGPVVSTGNYTLTGAGSGLTTISGLISATNSVTYAGSGTMQLTNPGNTFTGVIKATSGKLKLAPTGASLTSSNVFQSNVGAVLEFAGDSGNNNTLADATGLANSLNLGVNLFTAGTWNVNNGRNLKSDIVVDGASVVIAANRLNFSGTGTAGTIAFNMKSGSLATTSAATYGFRLNCDNGAVGACTAFAGTQSGGLITVVNGGGGSNQGFCLGGTSTSVVSSYIMSGGTMNVVGSGATGYLSLGADSAGTSTTTFALSGGRLYVSSKIEGTQTGANQIFNFTGGSLAVATINATNLRATGDIANGTFSENGANALLDVTGNNTTVTGNFALLSGSVQIGEGRTLTVNGALNGSEGAVITGIASGTGTLSVAPTTAGTFAGIIQDGSGWIALTKSGTGTMTLSGNNTYTGATTISHGTLALSSTGSIASSGTISVLSGGTFDVSAVSGGFTVLSGQTLNGNGTVQGATVINGNFGLGASPGSFTFANGNLTLSGTTTLQLQGTAAGTGYDQVSLNGGSYALVLGGALNAQFSGFTPTGNDVLWVLLNNTTGSTTGIFSGLADNATFANYGGFDWKITYDANSATTALSGGNDVAIYAVPSPEPGTGALVIAGIGILCNTRRLRGKRKNGLDCLSE